MHPDPIHPDLSSFLDKPDFTRRWFVVTTLASGFALAVPPVSAETITTDYRPSYRKAQAEDGWARMLAWFKKNGVAE